MSSFPNSGDFQIVLSRRLTLRVSAVDGVTEARLEIGFSPDLRPEIDEPAAAAYRIVPFADWRWIYGEDLIQALELTIQTAKTEMKVLGADWPDEDDPRSRDD